MSINSESNKTSSPRKLTFSLLLKVPIEFEIELLGIPEDNSQLTNFDLINSQLINSNEISISSLTPEDTEENIEDNNHTKLLNNQLLPKELYHNLSENLSEKIVNNFLQNPEVIPSIIQTLSEKINVNNQPETTAKVSFWVKK